MAHQEEMLLTVNENDEVTGTKTRTQCHAGDGILHRAITVFLFNSKGEVLITRRSQSKKLWSGFWDASCSTHVYPVETYEQASERRLPQELGIESKLTVVTKFLYHEKFGDAGSEYEMCALLVGTCDEHIVANPEEVSEIRWIPLPRSLEEIKQQKDYTPWLTVALQKYLEYSIS